MSDIARRECNHDEYTPLGFDDVVHALLDLLDGQRREPEARTATLDGGDDLVDVVADDAEADVLRILLDDAPERGLRGGGHHVGFVEDDELVAFGEERARLGEVLDLLADDFDAKRRVAGVYGGELLSICCSFYMSCPNIHYLV